MRTPEEIRKREERKSTGLSYLQTKGEANTIFGSMSAGFRDIGNGFIGAAYSGAYLAREANDVLVPLMALKSVLGGWNYFGILAEGSMIIHEIIRIYHSKGLKVRKYAAEGLKLLGLGVMGAGTTLSLLAYYSVFVGIVAVAFSPLISLTPPLYLFVTAVTEMMRMYDAIRKKDAKFLLKNRLLKIKSVEAKIREAAINGASPEKKNQLGEVYDQLREQALAIARVAYADKKIEERELLMMIISVNPCDHQFCLEAVKPPTTAQRGLVEFLKGKQIEKVRFHGTSAAFWLGLAVGVALVAVATSFFPPLMIPGVIIAAAAVAIKVGAMLEVDKRVYNYFSKTNKKDIKNDNLVCNYLAKRKMKEHVVQAYSGSSRLALTTLIRKDLGTDLRVKMRIAYELSSRKRSGLELSKIKKIGLNEKQFYKDVLGLGWWARRRLLNTAMETHIKNKALENCTFSKGLSKKDEARVTEKSCQDYYRFFGKSKVPKESMLLSAEAEPIIAASSPNSLIF